MIVFPRTDRRWPWRKAGRLAAFVALSLAFLPGLAEACARAAPAAAARMPVSTGIAGSMSFSEAMIAEVNFHRCEAGLSSVALERKATEVSAGHSLWMARTARMDHDSDLPGLGTFPQRLKAGGIRIRVQSFENIAHLRRFPIASECSGGRSARAAPSEAELARAVVDLWMGMPLHRRQTLDPKVKRAGGAAAVSDAQQACGQVFLTLVLWG